MMYENYINKVVTVIDFSNYRESYHSDEDYPMKAVLLEISDYPCYYVKSLKTGKEYELYDMQIEEFSK